MALAPGVRLGPYARDARGRRRNGYTRTGGINMRRELGVVLTAVCVLSVGSLLLAHHSATNYLDGEEGVHVATGLAIHSRNHV